MVEDKELPAIKDILEDPALLESGLALSRIKEEKKKAEALVELAKTRLLVDAAEIHDYVHSIIEDGEWANEQKQVQAKKLLAFATLLEKGLTKQQILLILKNQPESISPDEDLPDWMKD